MFFKNILTTHKKAVYIFLLLCIMLIWGCKSNKDTLNNMSEFCVTDRDDERIEFTKLHLELLNKTESTKGSFIRLDYFCESAGKKCYIIIEEKQTVVFYKYSEYYNTLDSISLPISPKILTKIKQLIGDNQQLTNIKSNVDCFFRNTCLFVVNIKFGTNKTNYTFDPLTNKYIYDSKQGSNINNFDKELLELLKKEMVVLDLQYF